MRRIFIVAGSILALVIVGVGGYILFFAHRASVAVAPPEQVAFPTGTSTGPVGAVVGTSTAPVVVQPASTASSTQPHLVQIAAGPVVPGVVVFDATTTSTSTVSAVVRYIDRQSGNVYSYAVANGELSRLSNKTIPGIERATWLADGSLAYVQYLSAISGTTNTQTYALPANGIGGFFLAQDLSGIAVQGSKSILTLASGANGSAATYAKSDDSSPYTAFQTPLSSVVASFAGPSHYLIYTKPSVALGGYAFLVNKKTGAFSQIAGPLDGLVARASPDGTQILVSYVDAQGAMRLELVAVATHTATELPLATIASKCVWASDSASIYCGIPTNPPAASYPDDWYQGAVAFDDQIWKIDVAGRYAQLVLDFSKETGGQLDATALSVDPKNTVLSFVNKNDGSLWEYRF
ncbi:MAG: hypothetical protein B7X04_02700 [Parcubacteria group bacterium 21-54-25]|nr:MAG: hypothetical protein B7X04_02700 [Parcubacteria group bacterium 21-54-25]HQU07738.1 hypothetical protein [Candidatus Paceibacterota bacterium]